MTLLWSCILLKSSNCGAGLLTYLRIYSPVTWNHVICTTLKSHEVMWSVRLSSHMRSCDLYSPVTWSHVICTTLKSHEVMWSVRLSSHMKSCDWCYSSFTWPNCSTTTWPSLPAEEQQWHPDSSGDDNTTWHLHNHRHPQTRHTICERTNQGEGRGGECRPAVQQGEGRGVPTCCTARGGERSADLLYSWMRGGECRPAVQQGEGRGVPTCCTAGWGEGSADLLYSKVRGGEWRPAVQLNEGRGVATCCTARWGEGSGDLLYSKVRGGEWRPAVQQGKGRGVATCCTAR